MVIINDKEFFHQASKRICGNLDAKTMLTDIRKYLVNFMPAQNLDLNTYEPENRILRNIASASFYSETPLRYPARLSKEAALFVETGRYGPVVSMINRSEIQPVAKEVESKAKQYPLCFLLLHLKVAEKRLGELMISARGRDLFCKEHARLLELLHDSFAVAIANILKHQGVLRLHKKLSDDYRYLVNEKKNRWPKRGCRPFGCKRQYTQAPHAQTWHHVWKKKKSNLKLA